MITKILDVSFPMTVPILIFLMTQPDKRPKSLEVPGTTKPRIQTQIHRRQKAKAVPPMKDEWDDQSKIPPNLRTPSSKMKKSPK